MGSLTETGQWQPVFNLWVADWHTEEVGCDDWGWAVWAHNADYNNTKRAVFENLVENRSIRSGHLTLFRPTRRGGFDLVTLEGQSIVIQEAKFANKLQFADFSAITTNLRSNLRELMQSISLNRALTDVERSRLTGIIRDHLDWKVTENLLIRVVTGKVDVGVRLQTKLHRKFGRDSDRICPILTSIMVQYE